MINTIKNLQFHKKMGLAFVLGCVATLSMPPLFLWPIMFLIFPMLIWMLDDIHKRTDIKLSQRSFRQKTIKSAMIGWFFGFGFFFFSLYWIGSSFLVEAEKFAIFLPLAITLLPAGLALFWGVAFAVTTLFWSFTAFRIIGFSLSFAAFEWLRGHLFTGFPWNLIGISLTGNEALMQSVAIFGIYGLTIIALLIFASFTDVLSSEQKWSLASLSQPALALIILGGIYSYGIWRLSNNGPIEYDKTVKIHLIQPNVPQNEKVQPDLRFKAYEKVYLQTKNLQLTEDTNSLHKTHHIIIWPETAIPYALSNSSPITKQIDQLLNSQSTLITGAYRLEKTDQNLTRVYNSLFLLDHKGQIISQYDKNHLVPFGEYLPFSHILRKIGFKELVNLRGGFTPGKPREQIKSEKLPSFLPYICYEAIFPIDHDKKAQWLLNISNDAWFGKTVGPHQHLHHVRLRAVEHGIPLIRSVNGGISAIFDSLGRTIIKTQLNEKNHISSNMPKPIPQSKMRKYDIAFIAFILLLFSSQAVYASKKIGNIT